MDEEKAKEIIADLFGPSVLAELYQRGEVTDHDDANTIRTKLLQNAKNIIVNMPVSYTISEQFYSAIKDEIKKERYYVAVCLSGVYIEQLTNEFYHKLLQWEHELSNKSFDDCMKSVSIKGKLTWLFTLVTSVSLDAELISKTMRICSERNKAVHFKPISCNIDEFDIDDDKTIDIGELIEVIDRLKNAYNETINNMFPEIAMGYKLYYKMNGEEVVDSKTE